MVLPANENEEESLRIVCVRIMPISAPVSAASSSTPSVSLAPPSPAAVATRVLLAVLVGLALRLGV